MRTKLKHFRVRAGLTQAAVAKKVGVTQPNYQRWESGAASVPENKLGKLARALDTNSEALLGRHAPIEATFYDDSAAEDLNYYGEVAIHFRDGGSPLLLSISDGAFQRLHRDLQTNSHFATVESLANQTVILRIGAISDLYFSSEADDTFGPEHHTYEFMPLQMPDPRDWEIVEALEHDIGLDDFADADVERVQKSIMITDAQFDQLVADGLIKPEDLASERRKNEINTEKIFKLASITTYQLSSGVKRDLSVYDEEALYEAFSGLIDFEDQALDEELIRLEVEGSHKIVFINKTSIDFISIPTHKYRAGADEVIGTLLDD